VTLGSIEYAVDHLGARLIAVIGHSEIILLTKLHNKYLLRSGASW
jgi:hypothetical protein